jgi:8-oxo-dGTP pyrophosphatase MutT (NUDIX family)
MPPRKHYVATGFVYDRQADSFLLVLHKKLGKWLPPGGHLEDGEEPHTGVLREVFEEVGVQGRIVELLAAPDVSTPTVSQFPSPFCVLSEIIPANAKEDEHIHIDFVYALEIDPSELLKPGEAEVEHAAWFSAEEIGQIDTFENIRRVCAAIRVLTRQKLAL